MTTKRIPTRHIDTKYGRAVINDHRNEEDTPKSNNRRVASIGIMGPFTINRKEYSDLTLYLERPRGTAPNEYPAQISGDWYNKSLTLAAAMTLAEELLTNCPELQEYFDYLDDDEVRRLAMDRARREVVRHAWKTCQDLPAADTAKIFHDLADQLLRGETIRSIYFDKD